MIRYRDYYHMLAWQYLSYIISSKGFPIHESDRDATAYRFNDGDLCL